MGLTRKKKVSPVTLICEIAVMAAVGFVLDELSSSYSRGLFVNGGSIGIAMISVIVMVYRRGAVSGLLTGLIIGLFDVMTGPYMVAASPWKVFLQVGLDYVFPYVFVVACAVFKPAFVNAPTQGKRYLYLALGTMVGALGKLLCHYLAGVLFWADPSTFAWDLTKMNPYLYCFLYNAAFILPSAVLTTIVAVLIYRNSPQIFLLSQAKPRREIDRYHKLTGPEILGIGVFGIISLASFVYFLIAYIRSYYYEDYGSYGSEFGFDMNAMVAWILALILIGFCVFSLLANAKGKYPKRMFLNGLGLIGAIVFVYGISKITRLAMKGRDYSEYFGWLGAGLAVMLIAPLGILLSPSAPTLDAK